MSNVKPIGFSADHGDAQNNTTLPGSNVLHASSDPAELHVAAVQKSKADTNGAGLPTTTIDEAGFIKSTIHQNG